jgi:hypothetical protein
MATTHLAAACRKSSAERHGRPTRLAVNSACHGKRGQQSAALRRLKSLVHISAKIIWARRGCRARKECQPPRDRVDWRRWIQTRKSADVSDDWITSRLLLRSTYAGCARFIYWCCIRLNWQIRHFFPFSLLGHLGSRSRAERRPFYIMRFIYHISPFRPIRSVQIRK